MTALDVTVAVCTFGRAEWIRLAQGRAMPSAQALDVPVIHVHEGSLDAARNAALDRVATEWIIYLDADDELETGYLAAMATGTADVRAPAVRYVQGTHAAWPAVPNVAGHNHHCDATCLPYGNWLVIGAMVRADLVRRVGGWRDYPWSEDWDLWLRCHLAGATFEAIPTAIYRAHVRRSSRNRGQHHAARLAAHRAIAAANGVPIP
jgi:glycosyltransferase involved in cell wall biosynthesis